MKISEAWNKVTLWPIQTLKTKNVNKLTEEQIKSVLNIKTQDRQIQLNHHKKDKNDDKHIWQPFPKPIRNLIYI